MSRLADPGRRAADRETARQIRLAAWRRPADQRTRDQWRAERVADGRAAMVLDLERRKQQLTAAAQSRGR
jgi:hypothetical protein